MTKDEFAKLSDGDLIRHPETGECCLVVGSDGRRPALIQVIVPDDPGEWELVPGSRPAEDPELDRILAETREGESPERE